uniref:Uncharacterized protein n=1 Tax=Nelumbo nucifera TaxID=4432 RepID=A0A822Z9R5_NELNU|nr:TPA_asm: hypothetical protein HUJ06_016125 [Nelumbo nucifera]
MKATLSRRQTTMKRLEGWKSINRLFPWQASEESEIFIVSTPSLV